jgi:phage tail protein X
MKKIILISALALNFIQTQAQVNNGLVAKYSFNNGNANDEMGANHGTVHGAILTNDRFGNSGKAYDFINGEYITLPDAPALKSNVMTVSLWVKIEGYNPGPNPQNYIYSIINSPINAYFATFAMTVNTFDSTYFSVAQNSPSESTYGGSTNPNSFTWQHNVLSISNDSIKMYIDGQRQWSYYKGFITTFTSDSIYIGVSGNTTYFGNLHGSVDDIRVYNRMLTDIEVDSLFDEPNPNAVGINETNSNEKTVSIYPNPATNQLNVVTHVATNSPYRIFDIYGRTVANGNIQGSSMVLNIEELTPGTYFLRIEDQYPTNLPFIKN